MQHVTQVKRAIKTLLIEHLPAKLDQADEEADDGVTTPHPHVVYTSEKQGIEGFPSIEIQAIRSSPNGDSFAQVYKHQLTLVITVNGDDEEKLATFAERYIWAIRQLCHDTLMADYDGPPTGPLTVGEEGYAFANEPGGVELPFVVGAFMFVTATTVGE